MNILVTNNKDGTLTVSVSVAPFDNSSKEEFIDTKVIKNYLKNKKIKFGNCLQAAIVANTSANKLAGEWIFENPSALPKKIVDTVAEPVIPSYKSKKV